MEVDHFDRLLLRDFSIEYLIIYATEVFQALG
jgi:hypothetical protein